MADFPLTSERTPHLGSGLASGRTVLSPEPFALPPATVDLIRRFGMVGARFWRAAEMIERRSQKGSLPAWISVMVRQGTSAPPAPPSAGRMFQASFRLNDSGRTLSLTSLQLRADGIGTAAWLQEAAQANGCTVIADTPGIRAGLSDALREGACLPLSATSPEAAADLAWLSAQLSALPEEQIIHLDGPLWLESPLWLALLCAAPLQAVWERELRSSNFRVLRGLLPMSWALDPRPLPHQAVIPRLGLRAFAELASLPAPGLDFELKPGRLHSGHSRTIRSQVPAEVWSTALYDALDDYGKTPWLLQERRGVEEAMLRVTYWERGGQVMTGSMVAHLAQGPTDAAENLRREEGEPGETLSVLAPCCVAKPGF